MHSLVDSCYVPWLGMEPVILASWDHPLTELPKATQPGPENIRLLTTLNSVYPNLLSFPQMNLQN